MARVPGRVLGGLAALLLAGACVATTGGTVGVGISTTKAVVQSSILVIVADFFLAKTLQIILGTA